MATIEVQNFSYIYPGESEAALRNIHFEVEAGQLFAILGANGAGKSTLCLALAGLIPHLFHGEMNGNVTVLGMNTLKYGPSELAGKVGLVLQNPANQLSGMRYTVYEEVAFGLENLGVPSIQMPERIKKALSWVGLSELGDRSPYALSGGQQQRLALASVLALEPQVLILDEPTAMLDPKGSQEIFEIIHKLTQMGKTVIIAEHRLEWVACHADRMLVLKEGEAILQGKPAQVMTLPLLKEIGIGWLRYTEAAYLGKKRNLWLEDMPLPVTLEQAVVGFLRV
jgi:energy-coupling factor transport system ATP-binding protein